MAKPVIEENKLHSGDLIATIWQQTDEGVAEPAVQARTYGGIENSNLIELRQGGDEILLNPETVAALVKMLTRWAKR